MPIEISSLWATGMLLASIRTAAFAVASPILAKVMPTAGRFAFALAVALAIATPVTHASDIPGLVGGGIVNLGVGLILAFVSGLPFYAFSIAGNVLELGAGLAAAQFLDPAGNHTSGVLAGMFDMMALAILLLVGGDRLIVQGIALSLHAVPLQGAARLPGGLGAMMIDSVGAMMLSGLALAAPVMAALFLADLALAALARFSPKTNAFIIGLPLKLLVTFVLLGAVAAIFPGVVQQVLATISHDMTQVLGGLKV